jgi:hypothetical protein
MPTHTIKSSPDYDVAAKKRAKDLGYASLSAYYKGLARYDMLVQGPHTMTLPWSRLPLADQDVIDAKLFALTKLGVGERGQYLKRILKGKSPAEKDAVQSIAPLATEPK